ncbi:hypothetical protein NXH64_02710 [Butyrivibrio fibrisolvens]|uniref:hypothetical protein n=1 Tax=Pseudobutyrivibrio ruminis TaxID=46206 RepID=UPI00048140CE|nr:hypothetical protein [Pseudobutyrivibrio ruminis]MDC7278407.1 hypothetical protein [Butyrivibrio fibrisolvens]
MITYNYQNKVPVDCVECAPEPNAALKALQYNLHIDDSTMDKILVGGAIAAAVLMVVLIAVIAADDLSGIGTMDDGALVPLISVLTNDIQFLINYSSQLINSSPSLCAG